MTIEEMARKGRNEYEAARRRTNPEAQKTYQQRYFARRYCKAHGLPYPPENAVEPNTEPQEVQR